MGLRYIHQKHFDYFFVTTTFFQKKRYGNILGVYQAQAESLRFLIGKYAAKIPGFVFMPSHLHLILSISGSELSAFMRDFKKYISQKTMPDLGIEDTPIWTPRFDRVALTTENILRIKLQYIHQNPVLAGLVERPELWKWSSASDYDSGVSSPVPVWKEWA